MQLRTLDDSNASFALAKKFVEGKIKNQMSLLKYINKYKKRSNGFPALIEKCISRMTSIMKESYSIPCHNNEWRQGSLFGIEGRAASFYWEAIGEVINGRVHFPGRKRKNASDLVNMLLNYGYAILRSRVYLGIVKQGLNPGISFLHVPHRGEPTLVFDLMEEFRAPVVDRTVVALLGRDTQLPLNEDGLLAEDTRRKLITAIHKRLYQPVLYHGKSLTLDEIIREQALSLVQHLKGKRIYRPYLAKW